VPHWKRNLVALCIVQTVSMIAFSSYMPLLPYYVQELGAESYAQAASWTALFSTGSALAMVISAPIWGNLGDRYGRKLMLARATLSTAIAMGLLSLVRSPEQLVAVRILQGVLGGTITASLTLVATETPERHLGVALGLLQMLQYAANAVGPFVGGVVTDSFGIRFTLRVAGGMMAVAFVATMVLVRERTQLQPPRSGETGLRFSREMLAKAASGDSLIMLVVMAIVGVGITVLSPVLSLYVKSLSPDSQRIATLAGAITSAAALTSSLSALAMGRFGDRLGPRTVLVACGLGAALTCVPQALVGSPVALLALRAAQGFFLGGIRPTAMALLARTTASSRRGTVFGLASSARAGGRAIGPLLGAASAHAWGMSKVFLVAAGVYGTMAMMVGALVRPRSDVPLTASAKTARGTVAQADDPPGEA